MSVNTRTKTTTSLLRRRRGARPVDVTAAPTAPAAQTAQTAPTADEVAVADARRRDRIAERPQDEAVYNCACGFVFSAAVSASVGCPHCGGAQAW